MEPMRCFKHQCAVTSVTMAGDVTSNSGTSVVNTLANGTLPVSNLVTLAGSNALTNKTITGTTNSVDANTLRFGSTYAVPLGGSAPTSGQVLGYNGTNAVFQTPTSTTSVTMAGDVTSNSATSVVSKINGTAVAGASTAATANMLTLRDSTGGGTYTNLTCGSVLNTAGVRNLYYDQPSQQLFIAGAGVATPSLGSTLGNIGIGGSALAVNTSGNQNNAVGYSALAANTTGNQNSAFGNNALIVNTTGNYNSAFGYSSQFNNTTGTQNTAVGDYSLYLNTTGNNNVGLGVNGGRNELGSDNTNVGCNSTANGGTFNSTGCTSLGSNAGATRFGIVQLNSDRISGCCDYK